MSNSHKVRIFVKTIFNCPDLKTKLAKDESWLKKHNYEYNVSHSQYSVSIRVEAETQAQIAKFKLKLDDYEELTDNTTGEPSSGQRDE